MTETPPRLLIIAGHQRSGTTLLRLLSNKHPQMSITPELGIFINSQLGYKAIRRRMIDRWWRIRTQPLHDHYKGKLGIPLGNAISIFRYLMVIRKHRNHWDGPAAIEEGMRALFPESPIVGDKYPDYIYSLDRLVPIQRLTCVVIYRDVRDVVSSTLHQVRTVWRERAFASKMDTAEKVAHRWLEAIDMMDKYRDQIYTIRYEDLIHNTKQELEKYGDFLSIDPAGFPANWVRDTSIGKYQQGLTPDELDTVLDIAGSKMISLGYDL